VHLIGHLLRAIPDKLVRLTLPYGVSNSELRGWARAGLLRQLEELHFLGHGGLSDAGLTYVARYCPRLRKLSVLSGNVSAAAALLHHAQVQGALSRSWWRGFRCTRLCILPRFERALQRSLAVQRVPSWFVGQWSPRVPTWGHEVQHYDAIGRVVYVRNSTVERVGVVRSMLPSPHGPWWELSLSFIARRDSVQWQMLILPVGPPVKAAGNLQAWGGAEYEPASTVQGAVVSCLEGGEWQRHFPQTDQTGNEWHRISRTCNIASKFHWNDQEWAENAVAMSVDDTAAMFLDDEDSSEEEQAHKEEASAPIKTSSMEEILAQLDLEEAEDLAVEDLRPSAQVAVGNSLPSVEEMLGQLDAEEARDRAA